MERAFGGWGEHGRWWNKPAMIQKMNLTEDQRKAMDAILDQHKPELIDLRARLEKAEVEMEPLMRADKPDESRILAQVDKIADARRDLEKSNARFLLAIRGKLTPDQWKQLQAMHSERHERMERREHSGQNGPGTPPPQQPGTGGPMGGPQFDDDMSAIAPASQPGVADVEVTRVLRLFEAD
jgi:Spy/CpxP family protein refolding chaperone